MVEMFRHDNKLFLCCLVLAQLFSVLCEEDKTCSVHASCYHFRFKSPWCGEVSLPLTISSYTSEVEALGCIGWSLKDLTITWAEILRSGEIREFTHCRQTLSCHIQGDYLRRRKEHHIFAKIQIPKIRRVVYLKATIYIRDLSKLSSSKHGRRSKSKRKSFREHWTHTLHKKVTGKQRLWGKREKMHTTNGVKYYYGQPFELSNEEKGRYYRHSRNQGRINPKLWGKVDKKHAKFSLSNLRLNVGPGMLDLSHKEVKYDPGQRASGLNTGSPEARVEHTKNVSHINSKNMTTSAKNKTNGSPLWELTDWLLANEKIKSSSKKKLEGTLKWQVLNEKRHHISARKQAKKKQRKDHSHLLSDHMKHHPVRSMHKFRTMNPHSFRILQKHTGKMILPHANIINVHSAVLEHPIKSSYKTHGNHPVYLNDNLRNRHPVSFVKLHQMNNFPNIMPLRTLYQNIGKGNHVPFRNQNLQSSLRIGQARSNYLPHRSRNVYLPDNGINQHFINPTQSKPIFGTYVNVPKYLNIPHNTENAGMRVSSQVGGILPWKSEDSMQSFPWFTKPSSPWPFANSKADGYDGKIFSSIPASNALHHLSRLQNKLHNAGFAHMGMADADSIRRCYFLKNFLFNSTVHASLEEGSSYPNEPNYFHLCRKYLRTKRRKRDLKRVQSKHRSLEKHSRQTKSDTTYTTSGGRSNQGPYELNWYEKFGNHNNTFFHGKIHWKLNKEPVNMQKHKHFFPEIQSVVQKLKIHRRPVNTVGHGKESVNTYLSKSLKKYSRNDGNQIRVPLYKERSWKTAWSKDHQPKLGKVPNKHSLDHNMNWQIAMEKYGPQNGVKGHSSALNHNVNWQMAMEKHMPQNGEKGLNRNVNWQMAMEKHMPQNGLSNALNHNVNWQMAMEKHVSQNGVKGLSNALNNNVNWQMAMENYMPQNGVKGLNQNVNWQMAMEKHIPQNGVKGLNENVNWQMAMEKHIPQNGVKGLNENVNWQMAMEKHMPQNGEKQLSDALNHNINWQMAKESHEPQNGEKQLLDALNHNVNWQMQREKHHMPKNEGRGLSDELNQNLNWQMAMEKHSSRKGNKQNVGQRKNTHPSLNLDKHLKMSHPKPNSLFSNFIDIKSFVDRIIRFHLNHDNNPVKTRHHIKKRSYPFQSEKNLNWHMLTEMHGPRTQEKNFIVSGKAVRGNESLNNNIIYQLAMEKIHQPNKSMESTKNSLQNNIDYHLAMEKVHQPKGNVESTKGGLQNNIDYHLAMEKVRQPNEGLQNNIDYHLAMEKVRQPKEGMESTKDGLQNNIDYHLAMEKVRQPNEGLQNNIDYHLAMEKVHEPKGSKILTSGDRFHSRKPIGLKWHTDYIYPKLYNRNGEFHNTRAMIAGHRLGLTSGQVYRVFDSKMKKYRLFCMMKDSDGNGRFRECPKHNVSTGATSHKEKETASKIKSSDMLEIQNNSKILNQIRAEIMKFDKLINMTAKEIKTLRNTSDLTLKTVLKESKWNHNLSRDGKYVQARVGDITAEVLKRLYNNSYVAAKKAINESHLFQYNNQVPSKPATNSSNSGPGEGKWTPSSPQHWGPWKSWSSCSVTCGIVGMQKRYRDCNGGQNKNAACNGTSTQVRQCNVNKRCPGDSQWSRWSSWSHCSVSCGSGYLVRNRSCKKLRKTANDCEGQRSQVRKCNMRSCQTPSTSTLPPTTTVPKAVKGSWSPWSRWSGCSTKCGIGRRTRMRKCGPDYLSRLFPKSTVSCKGMKAESKSCILKSCDDTGSVHKVLQGEETVLHCQYDHNKIDLQKIYWITPTGRKITSQTNNPKYEMIDGALRLKNIQRIDGGYYHCIIVGSENSMLGMDAQIEVTTCAEDPCQNGASCMEERYPHHSNHRHFTCLCPQGYYGAFCQKRKGPTQTTVLIISISMLAIAMFIAGIATCVICCRKKQGKKEYREEEMSPVITKRPKSGKRSRSQSRESLHSKGSAKSPKSCPALMVTTPDRVHKVLNSSIVSSDDSIVEINERDFKHFREDNIFNMYKRKGTETTGAPALIGESGPNTAVKTSSHDSANATPSSRSSRRSKFKDSEEQRANYRSRSSSREPDHKLENIYENTQDYPFAGNLPQEPIEGFRVSFKDQDFERYHRSFEEPSFQYSTPVKGGNKVNIDFDSGGINTSYSDGFQHPDDFEMNHHIQCSPMDSGYSHSPQYANDHSQGINDKSHNEHRGKLPRSHQSDPRHACLLPGHDLDCRCQNQWQLCPEELWPYDEKEVVHFERDIMNYPFPEHLRKLDPQYQYESEAGDSTVSQFDDSSYQYLVNQEDIPSNQGSPLNNSTKNGAKTTFSLDLDYFCEPVSAQITDTSSCETVQEAVQAVPQHFPRQNEQSEVSKNPQRQPDQTENESSAYFEGDADNILKDSEISSEFLSIVDSETVQNSSEKFMSADDISKSDFEERGEDQVELTSYSDTEIMANFLPGKNSPVKQPNERMCIDHFQMVYGTLSYKSPETPRQEDEGEFVETDNVTDGDI